MLIKTIIIAILLVSPLSALARSEISGYISTDPARVDEDINQVDDGADDAPEESASASGSGGSSVLFFSNDKKDQKPELILEEDEVVVNDIDEPVVLGFDRLPGNTLVRDESERIYIIKGEIKKVIWDLEELWQYKGKPILDLPDSELAEYPTRRFYDNELIRQNNTAEVYLIKNGRKQHVKNLKELANKFFGQKIYNVGKEEFVLYLI